MYGGAVGVCGSSQCAARKRGSHKIRRSGVGSLHGWGMDLWGLLALSLLSSGKRNYSRRTLAVRALPIATREKLYSNSAARKLVLSIAALIVITGFAVQGAEAIIDRAAKIALLHKESRGAQ